MNSFAAAVVDVDRQLHSVINFIRGITKFQISCQSCTGSLSQLNFGSAVLVKVLSLTGEFHLYQKL
jgi:hypothetical protein